MSVSCGIVYVATKEERYLAEAFLSATSVKDLAPDLPITLYTNLPNSVFARDACFDEVVPIQTTKKYLSQWAEGQLDRILCLPGSPYDRTLHLDTDTRVMSADFLSLFALPDGEDIAMAECANDNSTSRYYCQARMFNVGVILYRRCEKVQTLFKAWAELTAQHFFAASQADVPRPEFLAHIDDAELRARLLFMDQVSLVRMLSPDVNVFDLKVRILDERWNFRGCSDNRVAPHEVRINHHPDLRKVIGDDVMRVADRYRQAGLHERALEIYEFMNQAAPGNAALQALIRECRDARRTAASEKDTR
jgi:hypothetical protein